MPAKATLYRMVLPDHTCPYGVAAKERLEGEGYEVDEFKGRHDVETTPQVFIDGKRVGGFEHLERHLEEDSNSA
jgi:glutaredoxin